MRWLHRPEGGDRRGPHALRRRIRREQLRMLGLERAQLHHEPVVFGVRNLRIVERVIAVVVALQQLAQLRGARAPRRASPRPPCPARSCRRGQPSCAWKRATSSRSAAARCGESGMPLTSCTMPVSSRASSRAVAKSSSTVCSGSSGPGSTANSSRRETLRSPCAPHRKCRARSGWRRRTSCGRRRACGEKPGSGRRPGHAARAPTSARRPTSASRRPRRPAASRSSVSRSRWRAPPRPADRCSPGSARPRRHGARRRGERRNVRSAAGLHRRGRAGSGGPGALRRRGLRGRAHGAEILGDVERIRMRHHGQLHVRNVLEVGRADAERLERRDAPFGSFDGRCALDRRGAGLARSGSALRGRRPRLAQEDARLAPLVGARFSACGVSAAAGTGTTVDSRSSALPGAWAERRAPHHQMPPSKRPQSQQYPAQLGRLRNLPRPTSPPCARPRRHPPRPGARRPARSW